MAKFEFEYTEIDGLLYPNIEIGSCTTPVFARIKKSKFKNVDDKTDYDIVHQNRL